MRILLSNRFFFLLAIILSFVAALWLRLPELEQRPMHGDEANQAVRTGILMDQKVYKYDPTDHHGPVLYFAALPLCNMAGEFAQTREFHFRIVPVIFTLFTLLLMVTLGLQASGGLFPNRIALLSALLMCACSAPMAYFGRFFIQETMLVTFLTGMLAAALWYTRLRWCDNINQRLYLLPLVCFGIFAGLAAATKETMVLSLAAAGIAMLFVPGFKRIRQLWSTLEVVIAVGVAGVVAVLFFSSFFTHFKGVSDALFATAGAYFSRATKVVEHQHPWNFYLKTLFWYRYGKGPLWSEALLLLPALVAGVTAFVRRTTHGCTTRHNQWVRFLVLYTLLLTALYSIIPYKTPWCVLTFLHGYIMLAAIGIGYIWDFCAKAKPLVNYTGKTLVMLFVAALLYTQTTQAIRACFKFPADPRNPFVYAHTGIDALNLVATIEAAAARERGFDTPIAIVAPPSDTWPLPWYLRKFTRVGYWQEISEIPAEFDPLLLVVAADQGDQADQRFGKNKQAVFFGIRPGVLLNLFMPVVAVEE